MRKTVRLVILLLVVAVIYFGYSAWIDSVAIYNIGSVQLGSGTNWNSKLNQIWLLIDLAGRQQLVNDINAINPSFILGDSAAINNWDDITKILSIDGLGNIQVVNLILAEANKNTQAAQTPYVLAGFMGANSLLKTLLDPFKMVLVGGVFALFIPLTKQLLFGTIIGVKDYLKNRQRNVLYNYQKTISYVEDLQTKLLAGNYDEVKAAYASYSGLAFKPEFVNNMMDEVCGALIKEADLTIFAEPAQVVANALKEMYEKERRRSINGRGDELFFDLKRGYEYCARGSKYSIAYYKALQDRADNELGWKVYSLEIFKFNFFLIVMLIPALIISGFVGGLINGLVSSLSGDVRTLAVAATFFMSWVILTIIAHAFMIFKNEAYKNMKHVLIRPAIIYYGLYLLTFMTISAGVVGLVKVGNIAAPGTGSLIWAWFSAVAYLVLSTSLIFYVLATLVDSFKAHRTLSKKLLIDGVILPSIAWIIATVANFMALYGPQDGNMANIFAALNSVTLIGFWIYLSVSSFLINNLVSPNMAKALRHAVELEAIKEAKAKKNLTKVANKTTK